MENVYQAPQSVVADETVVKAPFYIVSQAKFLLLYVATFGLYAIYWFYRHWSEHRHLTKAKIWPVPRSIFSIFFCHSLFRKFDETAAQGQQQTIYRAEPLATVFVLGQIGQTVFDRLSAKEIGDPWTLILSLVCFVLLSWAMFRAQRVANLACDDPGGGSNASLGVGNVIWLILGGLAWAFFGFGIYAVITDMPLE